MLTVASRALGVRNTLNERPYPRLLPIGQPIELPYRVRPLDGQEYGIQTVADLDRVYDRR
jgi:hypothetical protein